jgi:hypothetical protein
VDQDAMKLRRVGEAIPVHLLHLSRFVRIEEEVAPSGAPRESQGGARVDDAGSGHGPCRSECHADSGLRDFATLAASVWRAHEWPPASAISRNHGEIREYWPRSGQRRGFLDGAFLGGLTKV